MTEDWYLKYKITRAHDLRKVPTSKQTILRDSQNSTVGSDLKCVFMAYSIVDMDWIGMTWLRTGTSGGLL
jgi:hypothetical protein